MSALLDKRPELTTELDLREFRRCLGNFVTGVTVITTIGEDGRRYGLTANSFSSVSLDPPLILWSQRLSAESHLVFRGARRFAVNILASTQVDVSHRFASPIADRFAGIATHEGLGGVPLIDGCAAYFECRLEAVYPGGDHAVFIGRVERFAQTGMAPLAFGNGKYMVVHPHDLGSLTADLSLDEAPPVAVVREATIELERLAAQLDLTLGLAVWGSPRFQCNK